MPSDRDLAQVVARGPGRPPKPSSLPDDRRARAGEEVGDGAALVVEVAEDRVEVREEVIELVDHRREAVEEALGAPAGPLSDLRWRTSRSMKRSRRFGESRRTSSSVGLSFCATGSERRDQRRRVPPGTGRAGSSVARDSRWKVGRIWKSSASASCSDASAAKVFRPPTIALVSSSPRSDSASKVVPVSADDAAERLLLAIEDRRAGRSCR